jgi:hypothetical protein
MGVMPFVQATWRVCRPVDDQKNAASILARENTYRKESVKMYGQQRANFDQASCARPKIVLN